MTFYTALGAALTDTDAAQLQFNGHPVYDVNGKLTTVVVSSISMDANGDNLIQLGEDDTLEA